MAVVALNLTSGADNTDKTSVATWTTASVSPTSNRLQLFNFSWVQATAGTITIAGNGLTWVQIGSTLSTGARTIAIFRALGTASSGTIVVTNTGGTSTSRAAWVCDEFGNVDQTGTNGSGAIVQTNTGSSASANSLSITLGSAITAGDATYGGMYYDFNDGVTPGTGYTELAEAAASEGFSAETEWRADGQTLVNWTTTSSSGVGGMAIEIKFVAPAVTTVNTGYAFLM